MLTNAALDADESSAVGLLVDYESLPGAIMGHVLPRHFACDTDPEDLQRMAVAGGVYSKARDKRSLQGEWQSDSEKKEKASTPAIRAAADKYLLPTFQRAHEATLAKTGGDDLKHLKEFSPAG